MSYIYNLTDTWNAAGTTFAGIKMAVTNTASDANSKLLDLSVSGATTGSFSVDKSGNASISGALTLGSALSVANGGTGLTSLTAGRIPFGNGTSAFGNSANIVWDDANARLGINGVLSYSFDVYNSSTSDVTVGRLVSPSAASGTSFTYLRLEKTNGFGGALGGYLQQGVGTGITLSTILSGSLSERLRIDSSGNALIGTTSSPSTGTQCLTLATGTAPTASPADTVTVYSTDRSAGNTIPSFYCEGSGVTNAGITSTTVTHKIAVRINGTIYYLLATTNDT